MKKLFLICTLCIALACKEDSKKTSNQENTTIETKRFVYYADAAVFQVKNDIYGVIIDDQMQALNNEAKAFKKEATDMVIADVEAQILAKNKDEEGWPYKLKIEKIYSVKALDPNKNDVIKLGK